MNLQQYADHRKNLGLRGATHVSVLRAIKNGRLSPPAVERQSTGWSIDPDLADRMWADATHPAERGTGHHREQEPGEDPPATTATKKPAAKQSQQQDLTLPKGVPPRAVSESVLSAVKARRETLELQKEEDKLVYKADHEIAYNAVLLQLTTKAASAHKQIKAEIPHLTHDELTAVERVIAEIFEEVSSHTFEELPE